MSLINDFIEKITNGFTKNQTSFNDDAYDALEEWINSIQNVNEQFFEEVSASNEGFKNSILESLDEIQSKQSQQVESQTSNFNDKFDQIFSRFDELTSLVNDLKQSNNSSVNDTEDNEDNSSNTGSGDSNSSSEPTNRPKTNPTPTNKESKFSLIKSLFGKMFSKLSDLLLGKKTTALVKGNYAAIMAFIRKFAAKLLTGFMKLPVTIAVAVIAGVAGILKGAGEKILKYFPVIIFVLLMIYAALKRFFTYVLPKMLENLLPDWIKEPLKFIKKWLTEMFNAKNSEDKSNAKFNDDFRNDNPVVSALQTGSMIGDVSPEVSEYIKEEVKTSSPLNDPLYTSSSPFEESINSTDQSVNSTNTNTNNVVTNNSVLVTNINVIKQQGLYS